MNQVKSILYTTATIGTITTAALQIKFYQNRLQQEKIDEDENSRDTSRPTNPQFGLKYGAGADLLMMEQFDNGDMIQSSHRCIDLFNFKDFINCTYQQSIQSEPYNNYGIMFRQEDDILVVNDNYGQIEITPYNEYLSYYPSKQIIARKLITNKTKKEEEKLLLEKKLYQNCKRFFQEISENQKLPKDKKGLMSHFIQQVLEKEINEQNSDILYSDLGDYEYDTLHVIRYKNNQINKFKKQYEKGKQYYQI